MAPTGSQVYRVKYRVDAWEGVCGESPTHGSTVASSHLFVW